MKNKLVVIAGPTAVGKTKYSIDFAKNNNGEIVSLDSVQVYKYLDIGSAKPSKEEMNEVKHYMIDEVMPDVNLNVKIFKEMANNYINEIYKKDKIPVLVGGTGFYIRAVLYDTDFLYEDDEKSNKIRCELYDRLKIDGKEKLYDELSKVDIESARCIHINNVKRIIRALEFYYLHGIPISEHNSVEKGKESKYDYHFYVLNINRDKLYDNINNRVDSMIKKGLLIEIKNLINMGVNKNCNSMRSIGYNELYDFCNEREVIYDVNSLDINSRNELNIIISLIKQHSRNYAKRQITWFRNQKNIQWINL